MNSLPNHPRFAYKQMLKGHATDMGSPASSTSSVSLPLTSTDGGQNSTSGCSGMSFLSDKKEQKKQKMKSYLKALKEMTSEPDVDTITLLRNLLKRLSDPGKSSLPGEGVDENTDIQSPSLAVSTTAQSQNLTLDLLPSSGMIAAVSDSMAAMLGYNKEDLTNHKLANFVLQKDLQILKDVLLVNDKSFMSGHTVGEKEAACYLRLRTQQDSVSDLSSTFKPFSVINEIITDTGQDLLRLEFSPLLSPYNGTCDIILKKTIQTQMTADCRYSYVGESACPLLGYLPQDLIGACVFDFYHPDDMDYLYSVYQRVVWNKHFTSRPYRMRVQNGDFINIETDWQSFVNPWTKTVQSIVCQHRVLGAPEHLDVFACNNTRISTNAEDRQKALTIQRKILQLLAQPLTFSNEDENRYCATNNNDAMSVGSFMEELRHYQLWDDSRELCNQEPQGTENTRSYNQLNCSHNIQRYLQSQIKSCAKYGASVQQEITTDDKSFNGSDVASSKCSSSITSINQKESNENETGLKDKRSTKLTNKCQALNFKERPIAQTTSPLTQEILKVHTKIQERIYMERASEPNDITQLISRSTAKKRKHSHNTPEKQEHSKRLKQGQQSTLNPRAANDWNRWHLSQNDWNICRETVPDRLGYPELQPSVRSNHLQTQAEGISYGDGPSSGYPSDMAPNNCSYARRQSNNDAVHPVQQQRSTGPAWMQPVLTGYYHPMTGCFQPVAPQMCLQSSAALSDARISGKQCLAELNWIEARYAPDQQHGEDRSVSSYEDSGSSLMYLLETDSMDGSCSEEASDQLPGSHEKQEVKDKKPIKRRLPHHPSWLQAVDWTENVKMQYQLPKNTMPLVLEDDWSKLSQIPHPVSVASQLKELGDIVQIDSTHQAVDEEAGFLLFPNGSKSPVNRSFRTSSQDVDPSALIVTEPEGAPGVSATRSHLPLASGAEHSTPAERLKELNMPDGWNVAKSIGHVFSSALSAHLKFDELFCT